MFNVFVKGQRTFLFSTNSANQNVFYLLTSYSNTNDRPLRRTLVLHIVNRQGKPGNR